jgi:hypothetical protein
MKNHDNNKKDVTKASSKRMGLNLSRSTSGKKARAPKWWGRMVENLPKIYIQAIRPKTWTPHLAQKWIKAVPSKCPFERQIWWGDRLLLYIPPLCPLNPLSSQLYEIRLEAQTYLANLQPRQSPSSQFID